MIKLNPVIYECLRWIVSIVLPATATLLSALNAAWCWGWQIEPILATFSAVETFLGVVFLGAKYANDHETPS
jgi:ribose/xylose/arabinose/galactoside ABC-type transport system permease subunit